MEGESLRKPHLISSSFTCYFNYMFRQFQDCRIFQSFWRRRILQVYHSTPTKQIGWLEVFLYVGNLEVAHLTSLEKFFLCWIPPNPGRHHGSASMNRHGSTGLGQQIHIESSDISIACHKMVMVIHVYDSSQENQWKSSPWNMQG